MGMQKVLVCDLDHTLLHTSSVLPSREELVARRCATSGDGDVFRVDISTGNSTPKYFWVKLRPGVRRFLERCKMLGITLGCYTNGVEDYAKPVLKCIDPDNVYFGERVITRDTDASEQKSLTKFCERFNVDLHNCIVLDDRMDVWLEGSYEGLFRIKPFFWFREGIKKTDQFVGSGHPREVEESMSFVDEDVCMLDVLLDVIVGSFEQALKTSTDLSYVISAKRSLIFQNMVFLFSGVFMRSNNSRIEDNLIYKECKRAGAAFASEVRFETSGVTHLIMGSSTPSKKYRMAKQHGYAKIVSLSWLFESLNQWKALPEDDFTVEMSSKARRDGLSNAERLRKPLNSNTSQTTKAFLESDYGPQRTHSSHNTSIVSEPKRRHDVFTDKDTAAAEAAMAAVSNQASHGSTLKDNSLSFSLSGTNLAQSSLHKRPKIRSTTGSSSVPTVTSSFTAVVPPVHNAQTLRQMQSQNAAKLARERDQNRERASVKLKQLVEKTRRSGFP